MSAIIIYTTNSCPYCHAAKELLTLKKAAYEEIDVTGNPELRAKMTEKAGGITSVPQIFINGQHIGGCDDLYNLEKQAKLDPLLTAAG
jgi:glutaredoxin 3